MTIQECYAAMGGNFNNVLARLRSEERISKFLIRVLDDENMELLIKSLEKKDVKEAFRAAHTLKGICLNLSITKLSACALDITEALRNREEYGEDLVPLLEKVKEEYDKTVEIIARFKAANAS